MFLKEILKMILRSNIAVDDPKNRRNNINNYPPQTFEQFSKTCSVLRPNFCTWISYESDLLIPHINANKNSITGFNQRLTQNLYFDFIPFDFDSDDLEVAFENCFNFITYLLNQKVPTTHFRIFLSGSKGFHVDVDRSVFMVTSPDKLICQKLKQFANWLESDLGITVDQALYSSTQLYRVPNSKHQKTGLHKVHIKLEDFKFSHIEQRRVWAAKPGDSYPKFTHTVPDLGLISLDYQKPDTKPHKLSPDVEVDHSKSIISNCPNIRKFMVNPLGREKRRAFAGVLLEAYGRSDAPEVQAFYDKLRNTAYMNENGRMEDAEHWIGEFERDGVCKVKKTCASLGCSVAQRQKCGTRTPADHLIKSKNVEFISVDQARKVLDSKMDEAFQAPGTGVYTFDMPVGIGKTTAVLNNIAKDKSLSVFYLCPTQQLAEQVLEDAKKAGIENPRRLQSRGKLFAKNGDFPGACVFGKEATQAQKNGLNVHETVCFNCPRHPANAKTDSCEYYKQFDGIKKSRMVIGVHAHANQVTFDAVGMEARSFLIVDESPMDTFSNEVKAIPQELREVIEGDLVEILEELVAENNNKSLIVPEVLKPLEVESKFLEIMNLGMEEEYVVAQEAARKKNIEIMGVKKRRARAYPIIARVLSGKAASDDDVAFLASYNYHLDSNKFLKKIIEKTGYGSDLGLGAGFEHLVFPDVIGNAITCMAVGQQYVTHESFFYPTRLPDKKVIILDATSSWLLYRKLIDVCGDETRELVYNKLPFVEQTHVYVTQVIDAGWGKTKILASPALGKKFKFIGDTIQALHMDKQICRVTTKSMKEFFANDKETSAHFGATRGLNIFEDYDYELIFGGYFIPDEAVVDGLKKLGIYELDVEDLRRAAVVVKNQHKAVDGSKYFSLRRQYESKGPGDAYDYANAIYKQAAVAEVVQAIRLRLFSGKEGKECIILTNVGLETVYADRFVYLDQLVQELEDESGISSGTLVEASTAGKKLVDDGPVEEKASVIYPAWDKWLAKFEGESFTARELMSVGPVKSYFFARTWLKRKTDGNEIEKVGFSNNTRYVVIR